MWAPEARPNDDDPREVQRRQEAYARELDQQIELRRMYQHKEQMEREELERKLAPSEHSPSKWLVEGGHLETSQSPCKFRQHFDLHDEPRQDRGAATCEVSSASSLSHPRFRVTDENETSQRLREHAQKMQWKRVLDEQVEEKMRLKQQEETETRRSEESVAREEVRYLREQQQRAQQRLGHFSPASNAEARKNRPESQPLYHAVASPPRLSAHRQRNDFESSINNLRNVACTSDPREDKDKSTYPHRDRQNGSSGAAERLLSPPAPSRIQLLQGNGRDSLNDGGRDTFDRSRECRQPYFQGNNAQASHQPMEQQSRVIEEYRLLLAEIRHERKELRRERDEVRREKDELRMQRVLLQLENEKMANLMDAQRALNEQHQSDFQTELVQQAQQLAHQQAMTYEHRPSRVQTVDSKEDDTRRNFQRLRQPSHDPEIEAYSRLSPIRQTLGDINIHDEQPQPVPLGRRTKPPSPMSMADFSTPTPNKRMTTNIVNSPGFQRLPQYRPIPAVPATDESVLNQSLVGDSVFVPLSPTSQRQSNNRPAASSPASRDINIRRLNPLQSSRVIKSRGFYNFEQEYKMGDKDNSFASESASGSTIGPSLRSSYHGDNDEYDASGTEDELDELQPVL